MLGGPSRSATSLWNLVSCSKSSALGGLCCPMHNIIVSSPPTFKERQLCAGSTGVPGRPFCIHIAESNGDFVVTPSCIHPLSSTGHSWPSLRETLPSLQRQHSAFSSTCLAALLGWLCWPFLLCLISAYPDAPGLSTWTIHLPQPHLSLASIRDAQVFSTISMGQRTRYVSHS